MSDALETWERAARPDQFSRPGVPTHRRGSALAAPPPASRVIELTSSLEVLRQHLAAACMEVRRLRAEEAKPDRFHSLAEASFGGVPMAQYLVDLILWEAILNTTPDFCGIVELGTWQGGFSLWLAAQANARRMHFVTYDAVPPERLIPGFERKDVFAEAGSIGEYIRMVEPVVLFCDNGNKPRELRTFPPYFRDERSIVVVHDWGTEVQPSDVPDTLEEIYGGYCDELGSLSRVFRVRR